MEEDYNFDEFFEETAAEDTEGDIQEDQNNETITEENNPENSETQIEESEEEQEEQEEESQEENQEEEGQEEENIDRLAFVNNVLEKTGYDLPEEFEPESDDPLEAFYEALPQIIEANSQPRYSSEIVQQLDNHVRNGGDVYDILKAQKQELEYSELSLDDEANQELVFKEYYKRLGQPEEETNEFLDYIKNSGQLEDKAKLYKEKLVETQQQEQEQLIQTQRQQAEQIRQQQQAQIQQIESSIDNLTPKNFEFNISNKDKKGFKEFLLQPKYEDDQGNQYTPYQAALQDKEQAMKIAYLLFKDATNPKNIEKLISSKVTNKVEENLKKRLSKDTLSSNKGRAKQVKQNTKNELDIFDDIANQIYQS